MKDISKLQQKSNIHRAWAVNNSMRTINEPKSTEELTDWAIKILDPKYEKADLPSIIENHYLHLSLQQRTELLNFLMKF